MNDVLTAVLALAVVGAVFGFVPGYKALTENNDGPGLVALVGGIGAIVFGVIGLNIQSGQASGIPVQIGIPGGVAVIVGLIAGMFWGDHVANPKATK